MADHPITPPQEVVNQWRSEAPVARDGGATREDWIARTAYAAGADAQLSADTEWVRHHHGGFSAQDLRAAMRPKPPSLKEQALYQVESFACSMETLGMDVDTIRRALEALSDD